ncbi:sigma-70 family RNA polymerase sigma factor [uncultured Clostridium sp.]|uniref:sigma-70 family RNA polymerase sigma factor n=1 Tax=uncultured Clostridium sp. TaxID=59620 RepID=UPI002620918D|nr:sigma-70 family RNA polymerase sigma factor [uncultured Clostridium sp.]
MVNKKEDILITNEVVLNAKNGDKHCRQMILDAYVPLVLSLVRKFHINGYTHEDLVQYCNLTILNSILCFNSSVTFGCYIKKALLNNLSYLYRKNPKEKVPSSLDIPCDFGTTIVDLIIDEDAIIDKDILFKTSENTILSALEYLDNEERHLCEFLIFTDYPSTLSDYSRKYGVSYEKVKSLKRRAKNKLTNILKFM